MKTQIALFLLSLSFVIVVSEYSQNLNGKRWEVTESGSVNSTWIEREDSGVFDAEFTDNKGQKIVAVYKVSFDDDTVFIQRIFSSNGEYCSINGKLNADSSIISGICYYPLNNSNSTWKAVVKGLRSEEINLTGKWKCSDNGIYYIRQSGDTISWYGEQQKEIIEFTNVAYGRIENDKIYLNWYDVPKGTILGKGEIILKIISFNTLERISATGDFGGSKWERMKASFDK